MNVRTATKQLPHAYIRFSAFIPVGDGVDGVKDVLLGGEGVHVELHHVVGAVGDHAHPDVPPVHGRLRQEVLYVEVEWRT